jgi:beta-N-acetylhexosaminidase
MVDAMSVDEKIGQLFIVSIPGTGTLPPEARTAVARLQPGAVILFGFNARGGPGELRAFTSQVQEAASGMTAPILIAVDHEGGGVQRLVSGGFTRLPAPADLGRYAVAQDLERLGFLAAGELSAVGVRLNLAPVVERSNPQNAVFLGTRSYSSEPEPAAKLPAAFARGMERAGVGAVYKHFPGNSSADPHKGLTVLDSAGAELNAAYVQDFRLALRAYRPAAVMLSHVMVPALDDGLPASLSPAVVGILRKGLRYEGIIMTDDLEMGALRQRWPVAESSVLAILAGADMLMLSVPSSFAPAKAAVKAALESGRLAPGRLEESCLRIVKAKLSLGLLSEADPTERQKTFSRFAPAASETAKFVRGLAAKADIDGGKPAP